MPDSFGKRQRERDKAKKALQREERRVARQQRRADRASGVADDSWLGEPPDQGDADEARPAVTEGETPEPDAPRKGP